MSIIKKIQNPHGLGRNRGNRNTPLRTVNFNRLRNASRFNKDATVPLVFHPGSVVLFGKHPHPHTNLHLLDFGVSKGRGRTSTEDDPKSSSDNLPTT